MITGSALDCFVLQCLFIYRLKYVNMANGHRTSFDLGKKYRSDKRND